MGRRLAIDSAPMNLTQLRQQVAEFRISTPFRFAQNDTSQGFVARATRACRRCACVALRYSPTRMYAGNAQKKIMKTAGHANDLLFLRMGGLFR